MWRRYLHKVTAQVIDRFVLLIVIGILLVFIFFSQMPIVTQHTNLNIDNISIWMAELSSFSFKTSPKPPQSSPPPTPHPPPHPTPYPSPPHPTPHFSPPPPPHTSPHPTPPPHFSPPQYITEARQRGTPFVMNYVLYRCHPTLQR